MRSSFFAFTLFGIALASPVPHGFSFTDVAKSGNSGNVDGGSVTNKASPWGSITNAFGSCKYPYLNQLYNTNAAFHCDS